MTEDIDYKAISEQVIRENEELKRKLTLLLMKKSWTKEIGIFISDFIGWCATNLNKIVLVLNGIFVLLGIVYMLRSTIFGK